MHDKVYAVIDTNVIVSALISKSLESNPVKIIKAITQERIIPLFNDEILSEYREVLSRTKFGLEEQMIDMTIQTFLTDGLALDRTNAGRENFPDEKDIVFYEVALSKEDSFLVTGNIKHFPQKAFVVSPTQMVMLLEKDNPISLEPLAELTTF